VAPGIVAGLLTGGVVGAALLQILAGVFDPPADRPAVPIVAVGLVVCATVLAVGLALLIADRALAHLKVAAELRER